MSFVEVLSNMCTFFILIISEEIRDTFATIQDEKQANRFY